MGSLIQDILAAVHRRHLEDRSGDIFRGIPAMERVDPDSFGLCLATVDGYVYEAGDTRLPFCIQSVSKPFTYGLALADRGMEAVDAKIDVEPSGEQYNRISLDERTNRPLNAMINAGALVAASLVAGETPVERAARVRATLAAYAGRELGIDRDVLRSETESGHRNRAIGHMLREFGVIEEDPDRAIEVYLHACATTVTCHDLGLMGATLANGGLNPVTGARVLTPVLTERVLSVMATCGMYDASGEWLAAVGMAAKSGIGGGIVAVLPGQLAIAAFSPRLDETGNSIRAFRACRQLSDDLELHAFHVARGSRSAVRASYDIVEVPSALRRPESDRRLLERHGHTARVYELHGDLLFAGAESAVREMSRAAEGDLEFLVADVRRVVEGCAVSRDLLVKLREYLRESGCEAFLVDPDGVLSAGPRQDEDGRPVVFARLSEAVAFIEDELLRRHGGGAEGGERVELADHPGLDGVDAALVERLRAHLAPRVVEDGGLLAGQGDEEAGVFFVSAGRVCATLERAAGDELLVELLTAGATIGGAQVVTGTPHPVTLRAEGPVEALELTRERWRAIVADDPELHVALLTMFMHAFHEEGERARSLMARSRPEVR